MSFSNREWKIRQGKVARAYVLITNAQQTGMLTGEQAEARRAELDNLGGRIT